MPGLPFQPLPASVTAESIIQEQFEEQKKRLQEQFNLSWNTVRQRAGKTLRPVEANEMLAELHAKGQMAALELTQTHQSQMDAFKRIDQMTQTGQITNGAEAKLRMVFGPEAERYLPQKKSPEEQFKNLESMEGILERDLKLFQLELGTTTGKRDWGLGSALRRMVGGGNIWGLNTNRPEDREIGSQATLTVLRPEMVYNKTTGSYNIKYTKKGQATNEEIDQYEAETAELDRIRAKKTELLSQISSANQLQLAGFRKMGAFEQKITASMQNRLTPDETAEGWKGYGPSFRGQATVPQGQPAPTGNIRVRSPDGKEGSIPAEDWEEAKRNGFVRI